MSNKSIYSLRILCSSKLQLDKVSEILKTEPTKQHISNIWILNIEDNEDDKYFDFINHFLDILKPVYSNLELIGILKNSISIWVLREYNDQCNLEFLPKDLKRIGYEGISLCISCWT